MYTATQERYATMEYNRCGNSGLLLPKVSLGLWHNFGDTANFENMKSFVLPLLITELHSLTWQIIMVRFREAPRKISVLS